MRWSARASGKIWTRLPPERLVGRGARGGGRWAMLQCRGRRVRSLCSYAQRVPRMDQERKHAAIAWPDDPDLHQRHDPRKAAAPGAESP